MKNNLSWLYLLLLAIIFPGCVPAQPTARQLHDSYRNYQEPGLKDRRFKHEDIVPLIRKLPASFQVKVAGQSMENRDIYRITWGQGPVQVLLWSQMHGDEPTATAALFDIFRFLQADDQWNDYRRRLASQVTLVFIPMLNPDGAARFIRRNALGIDLNRDAVRQATPEARLLKGIRDEIKADWGFNLHDQSRYYSAGYPSKNTATLAFLAPAYNFAKDINPIRQRAMVVIGQLSTMLQSFIPGKVSRYDDAFEPRAFGDNMQKWGTSTILIESGGYPDDREKQYIRQLNFVTILTALTAISEKQYEGQDKQAYEAIPINDSNNFFDLLLREVQVNNNGKWYTVDLGFRTNEIDYANNRQYYPRGSIADMGDLTYHVGYAEPPVQGMRVRAGGVYPQVLADYNALRALNPATLIGQGYTYVRLQSAPKSWIQAQLPIEILKLKESPATDIQPYTNAALLVEKDSKARFVVANGQLFAVEDLKNYTWPQ